MCSASVARWRALKGKKQVRVKFVAHPRKQVGEIYGVRLVKP